MAIGIGLAVVDVSVTRPAGVATRAAAATCDGRNVVRIIGWSPAATLLCPFRSRHTAGCTSLPFFCLGAWVSTLLGLLGWAW
jgi:hypothetical protein